MSLSGPVTVTEHVHHCNKCGATTKCYGGKGRSSRIVTLGRNGEKHRWIIGQPNEFDHICFKCGHKFQTGWAGSNLFPSR